MKKVAIIYICTGNYDVFWDDFYKSSEKDMKKIVEKYTWEKLVNNKLIPFYLK